MASECSGFARRGLDAGSTLVDSSNSRRVQPLLCSVRATVFRQESPETRESWVCHEAPLQHDKAKWHSQDEGRAAFVRGHRVDQAAQDFVFRVSMVTRRFPCSVLIPRIQTWPPRLSNVAGILSLTKFSTLNCRAQSRSLPSIRKPPCGLAVVSSMNMSPLPRNTHGIPSHSRMTRLRSLACSMKTLPETAAKIVEGHQR